MWVVLAVALAGLVVGGWKTRAERQRLLEERATLEEAIRRTAKEKAVLNATNGEGVSAAPAVVLSPKEKRRRAALREIDMLKQEIAAGTFRLKEKWPFMLSSTSYSELFKIPEYAALNRVVVRGRVEERYAEFLAEFSGDAELRETVISLLVEEDIIAFGGDFSRWMTDVRFGESEHMRRFKAREVIKAKVAAALSNEDRKRFKALKDWRPEQGVGRPIAFLQNRLSYSDEPLSREQFEVLRAAALKMNPKNETETVVFFLSGGMETEHGHWPEELQQEARRVLSPKQLGALAQIQEEARARKEANRMYSAARGYDD